jgi:hypothetical protein
MHATSLDTTLLRMGKTPPFLMPCLHLLRDPSPPPPVNVDAPQTIAIDDDNEPIMAWPKHNCLSM